MRYGDLIQLYFERSNALQWYWTLYVIVIGGLLAFSSLRQRPDTTTAVIITVLYACFAYKNLSAIGETTHQRLAILAAAKEASSADSPDATRLRQLLEPTLQPPSYEGVRNFHLATDVLTVAAFWAMEWRRHRWAKLPTPPTPP
jgi:hypothetical protein